MQSLKNNSHGGNVWPYIRQKKNRLIDFSVNTGPLGPSARVKNIIAKNIDKISLYPEPASERLKKRLASFHRISAENILMGNGSVELIYLIPRIIKGKGVLIDAPAFSEYEFAARAAGKNPVFIIRRQADNFKTDLNKLTRNIPRAGLVFICNPNNPTASLVTRKEILTLLKECEKNKSILAIDEAFIDFACGRAGTGLIAETVNSKYLLILRSLTKFFSIPGLRLGYLIGHTFLINRISGLQYPWNISSLAQIAGEEAVKDKKYIKQTKDCVRQEKKYLFNELIKIKEIQIYPSEANFFLCRLNNPKMNMASRLRSILLKKGILIRDCANFRGLDNSFFRIAVKTREESSKLISALRGTFNEI